MVTPGLADLPREVRAKIIAKHLASLFDSPDGGSKACAAVDDWCTSTGYVLITTEESRRAGHPPHRRHPCSDEAVWEAVVYELGLSDLAARHKKPGETWKAFLRRWCHLHTDTVFEMPRTPEWPPAQDAGERPNHQ